MMGMTAHVQEIFDVHMCMQAAELRAPQSSRHYSIFKSFVDQVKSEVERCAAGCLLRRMCWLGCEAACARAPLGRS